MRFRLAGVVLALAAAVAIGQVPMYSDYPWGLLQDGVDKGPVWNLDCQSPIVCDVPSYGNGRISYAGSSGGGSPFKIALALSQTTRNTTVTTVGGGYISGSDYSGKTVKFEAVGFVQPGTGNTLSVVLYDVTHAATISTLTLTGMTSGATSSGALTLPTGATVYEVQLRNSGAGGGTVTLLSANLTVS